MKKLALMIVCGLLSYSSVAESSNDVAINNNGFSEGQYLEVDVLDMCRHNIYKGVCNIQTEDLDINISCSRNQALDVYEKRNKVIDLVCPKSNMIIRSNSKRIFSVAVNQNYLMHRKGDDKVYTVSDYQNQNPYFEKGTSQVVIYNNVKGYAGGDSFYPRVSRLFMGFPVSGMNEHWVMETEFQKRYFTHVLDVVTTFQQEIARSHQGHLNRYIQALKDGIAVLEDERKYSVLNWKVQESSRRIMVYGMVIAEILDDYSHVTRLGRYITDIQELTDEIRKSYGWDRGLAGNVSKASGALLELVELELIEIAKIKIAAGFSNMKLYTGLLSATKKLMAKVNASQSGDMVSQREIFNLVDEWNSNDWQNELEVLMSAPVDFKKLVTHKLKTLLVAIESIEDLTKIKFDIPVFDREVKPTTGN